MFSQGSPLHFAPCLPASRESSCLGGSGSGGHFAPLQRCHGLGGLSFVPGVLWKNFCDAQGFGPADTSAGSLHPPHPTIFAKVARELCLHVRARGIRLRVYLVDWLVLVSPPPPPPPPPGVVLAPLSAGSAPVPQLGFLSHRGEILPQALTAVRVPKHDLQHPVMVGVAWDLHIPLGE